MATRGKPTITVCRSPLLRDYFTGFLASGFTALGLIISICQLLMILSRRPLDWMRMEQNVPAGTHDGDNISGILAILINDAIRIRKSIHESIYR